MRRARLSHVIARTEAFVRRRQSPLTTSNPTGIPMNLLLTHTAMLVAFITAVPLIWAVVEARFAR
jgi:hypothetical protein